MRLIDYITIQSDSGKYKIIYSSDIFDDEKGIEKTLKDWINIYEDIFSKDQSLNQYITSNIKNINQDIEVTALPDDVKTDENTDRNRCVFLKNKNQTQSKAQSDRYDRYVIKSDSGRFIVAYKVDAKLTEEEKKKIKSHINAYENSGLYRNYEQSLAEYLVKNCVLEGKKFEEISKNDPDFVKENPAYIANLRPKEAQTTQSDEKEIYSDSKKSKVIVNADANLNEGEREWIKLHLDYYEEKAVTVSLYSFLQENCGIKDREFVPPDNTIPDNQKGTVAFIQKLTGNKKQKLFEEKEKATSANKTLTSESGKSRVHYPKDYTMADADMKIMQTVMNFYETSTDNKKPLHELLNSSINSGDVSFIAGKSSGEVELVPKKKQEVSVKQESQPYAQKLEDASYDKKDEQVKSKQDQPPVSVPKVPETPSATPSVNVNVNVQQPAVVQSQVTKKEEVASVTPTSSTQKLMEENSKESKERSEKSELIKEYEKTGQHLYQGIKNNINTVTNFLDSIFGGESKTSEKNDKSSTVEVISNTEKNADKLKEESEKIQSTVNNVTQRNETSTVKDISTTSKTLVQDKAQTNTDTSKIEQNSNVTNQKITSDLQGIIVNNDSSDKSATSEKIKETKEEKSNLEKEMELTKTHFVEGAKNVIDSISNIFDSIFGKETKENKTSDNKISEINTKTSSDAQILRDEIKKETTVAATPSENKTSTAFTERVIQSETTPSQESTMMQQATGELTNAIKTVSANAERANRDQNNMQIINSVSPAQSSNAITLENPTVNQTQTAEQRSNENPPVFISGMGQQGQGSAMVSLTNNTIAKLASEIVKSMTLSSFLNRGT